jgi:glutamyl-tRNA reductase
MDTGARERLSDRLAAPDPLFAEQLLLHTCHRVEKIGLLANGRDPELPVDVRRYAGAAAVERVLLVAGGFDSAVVGEEQILGQVRDAFQVAQDDGTSGPVLSELMRRAIRFGKRVRSEARPIGDRSLADRGGRWLTERLATGPGAASALVIGTGEMGRLLAGHLAGAGIAVTVASRHLGRARELAAALPGPAVHHATLLDEVLAGRSAHAGVAIALRGGTTPIGTGQLAVNAYVVDLSAPRTVTAEAAEMLGDHLLDLDALGAGERASVLAPAAERRLREEARREAQRFVTWLELRTSGDGIALLRHHADEVRRRHVDRVTARAALSAEQAAAVDAMARALVGELLHVPTVQLGRDADAAARVREVFGID